MFHKLATDGEPGWEITQALLPDAEFALDIENGESGTRELFLDGFP